MKDVEYGSISQINVYHGGELVGRESEVVHREGVDDLIDAHKKIFKATSDIVASNKAYGKIKVEFWLNKKGVVDRIEIRYRERYE